MSGHVFHPGHEELHGVTVVLDGASGKTYVGRYHERTSGGLLLHDVAVHDPASGVSREEFLRRTHKFGVRAEHKNLVVPEVEVREITRLADVPG
ncbi:MAG: hypothetical protein ACOY71_07815 [Gemmatimonadota bacterium]